MEPELDSTPVDPEVESTPVDSTLVEPYIDTFSDEPHANNQNTNTSINFNKKNITFKNGNVYYDNQLLKIRKIRQVCKQYNIKMYTSQYRYRLKKDLVSDLQKYINE